VLAPDLPGHGQNRTADIETITLEDYARCVTDVLDKLTRPAIVVGHSLGGITVSQATEHRPHKVAKAVYLCAFLLGDGQAALRERNPAFDPLSFSDERLKGVFYGDCSDHDLRFARARLVPEPPLPGRTAIHVTGQNSGSVPRVYITCLKDQAIAPDRQRQMFTTMPCQNVIAMNTSHSPFFSAPEELARHLVSLV
jgi:pimeloyl-ACP methyl ester carboxylesterase